jgi:type II secretory pathway component PulM
MMEQLRKILDQLLAYLAPYIDQAREAISPYASQLQARYQKLEPREKTLVRIASAVFALFIVYDFFYLPITTWRDSIDTALETRQREAGQVQHLVDTYLERKKQLADAERNTVPTGKDFSLFSVLEKSLTASIGREKIASITPGSDRKLSDGFVQYSVDLKLQDVNLNQIVDALYGVKTLSAPVAVSNMRVTRRTQDPHTYDVEMTCIALAKGA